MVLQIFYIFLACGPQGPTEEQRAVECGVARLSSVFFFFCALILFANVGSTDPVVDSQIKIRMR